MRTSLLAAVVGLFLLLAAPVQGQGVSIDLGPRVGYDLAGDIEELFIGADARFGVPSLPVVINPTFDYYLVDNVDFFQFSANALYDIAAGALPNISPYVGAGLGISRFSVDVDTGFGSFDASSTDIGLNLIGGGSIDAGGFKPYAQLQITLSDANLVTLAVGALFSLGG